MKWKSSTPSRTRWLKRGIVLLAVYALVGFFVLPAIIKWQLKKQLPPVTKRLVAVEGVRVNPFTFSLTVRGLSLTETAICAISCRRARTFL